MVSNKDSSVLKVKRKNFEIPVHLAIRLELTAVRLQCTETKVLIEILTKNLPNIK